MWRCCRDDSDDSCVQARSRIEELEKALRDAQAQVARHKEEVCRRAAFSCAWVDPSRFPVGLTVSAGVQARVAKEEAAVTERNLVRLYATAVAEIKRKNRMMDELRAAKRG